MVSLDEWFRLGLSRKATYTTASGSKYVGNTDNGDCGSASCTFEPEFSVFNDPVDLCTIDGVAVDCDDADLCTTDTCDPATGLCAHHPIPGCLTNSDEVVVAPGVIVTLEVLGGSPSPGGVEITFDDTSGGTFIEESDLAIFHYKDGEWTELNGSIDEVGNTVTVPVASFSYFALGASSIQQVPSVSPAGIAVLCGLVGLANWRRLRR